MNPFQNRKKIGKGCLLLLCFFMAVPAAHAKKLELSRDQKEWKMNEKQRANPYYPAAVESAGYRFVRAYRASEKRSLFGQAIPAQDVVSVEWKMAVKHTRPNTDCVEVAYILEDSNKRRLGSSALGKRMSGPETHTFQDVVEVPYDDAMRIVAGAFRTRTSDNLFASIICTGASLKDR